MGFLPLEGGDSARLCAQIIADVMKNDEQRQKSLHTTLFRFLPLGMFIAF